MYIMYREKELYKVLNICVMKKNVYKISFSKNVAMSTVVIEQQTCISNL